MILLLFRAATVRGLRRHERLYFLPGRPVPLFWLTASAYRLTEGEGQECRRKTCEECDEILHLVEANKSHHRVSLFPTRTSQASDPEGSVFPIVISLQQGH